MTVYYFFLGGAKRKAHKRTRQNPPVIAAPSIEQLNETPQAYSSLNLRIPTANVYVLERDFAPVHGGKRHYSQFRILAFDLAMWSIVPHRQSNVSSLFHLSSSYYVLLLIPLVS